MLRVIAPTPSSGAHARARALLCALARARLIRCRAALLVLPYRQVAILTERIRDLMEHFKAHRKDHHGMRYAFFL